MNFYLFIFKINVHISQMQNLVGFSSSGLWHSFVWFISQNVLQIRLEVQNMVSVFAEAQRPACSFGVENSFEEVLDEFLGILMEDTRTDIGAFKGSASQFDEFFKVCDDFYSK